MRLFLLLAAGLLFVASSFTMLRSPVRRADERRTLREVGEYLCVYKDFCDALPDDIDHFKACQDCDLDLECEYDVEQIRREISTDIWKNPVAYERTSSGARLTSFGRDGRRGGEGTDADIIEDVRCE